MTRCGDAGAMSSVDAGSWVYLLHFERAYPAGVRPQHYVGTTKDLATRLLIHYEGAGARLLAVCRGAGIGWTLAGTRPGSYAEERWVKSIGGARRHCPLCGGRLAGIWD